MESGNNLANNPAIKLPAPINRQYKCKSQFKAEHLPTADSTTKKKKKPNKCSTEFNKQYLNNNSCDYYHQE